MRQHPAGRSRAWDITMIVLLVGSVALVYVYEALQGTGQERLRQMLVYVDLALVAFFVIEWLWRVRNAEHQGHYALRQSWELLGMIPLMLPVPAGLRALRLLRIVRIVRVFGTIGRRLGVWQRVARAGHLKPIAIAGASVTLLGATLVWLLERDEPVTGSVGLDTFSQALWWAIVTVTTVGYGDVTPVTAGGRFIAAGLMVVGIGIIGLLASSLASALLEERRDDESAGGLPEGSVAAELRALSRLHEQGHLDEDEFSAAKARVLAMTKSGA